MHAVIRTYAGESAKELFDLLEQRKADVERIIRAVPGFQAYSLFRTVDGGVSVTVCRDKAGTEESLRVAREWVQQNAAQIGAKPPAVAEGAVILQLS